jgi:hypothetical protein
MTSPRDPDRILRAWLDLMPDEVPDDAVAAVLQAVATTPQTRRPWQRLSWRSYPMSRTPLAIGVAAVIVAAGALLLMRPGAAPEVGGPPTPGISASPSVAPGASPSGTPLPTAIQARWMSGHRDIVDGEAGTTMLLDATAAVLSPAYSGPSILMRSVATGVGADKLRLVTPATDTDCAGGAEGTYSWTLSPSGRTLTVTAEGDDCQARADAVSGEWWLMACKNAENYCLGELSAGRYASQFINPRVDTPAAWVASYGQLGFTVPDGWANASDWPESYELMPSDSFATTPDSPPVHEIVFSIQPSPLAKDAACVSSPPPAVGISVDELVGWLGTINGLIATGPTPISISGHDGQWLDLRVDQAADGLCLEDGKPLVEYMTSQPSGVIGEQRQRLILLDIGAGDVLAIALISEDPATFDAFVAEAMPVVESVEIRPAP